MRMQPEQTVSNTYQGLRPGSGQRQKTGPGMVTSKLGQKIIIELY